MIPSVSSQYEDALADRMTGPDRVAEGIWSIPLAMPDRRNPYIFTYVLEGFGGELHLIDSGYESDGNWRLLLDSLHSFGLDIDRVASVFVTHLHPDHLGMAERIRSRTGARVRMLRREQEAVLHLAEGVADIEAKFERWGVPMERRDEIRVLGRMSGDDGPTIADEVLDGPTVVDFGSRRLEVVATPGHTPGHACLVDRAGGIVFTGDHVLPKIYPGLGLGGPTDTNPIADYFLSLDVIERFDDLEVAPGHAYRFRGLAERCAEIRQHHLKRSMEAEQVLAEQPGATTFEIASRLSWTAGWGRMTGFFLFSALSQTEQHLEFVAAGR